MVSLARFSNYFAKNGLQEYDNRNGVKSFVVLPVVLDILNNSIPRKLKGFHLFTGHCQSPENLIKGSLKQLFMFCAALLLLNKALYTGKGGKMCK